MGELFNDILKPLLRDGADEEHKRIATALEAPDLTKVLLEDKVAVGTRDGTKLNVDVDGSVSVKGDELVAIATAVTDTGAATVTACTATTAAVAALGVDIDTAISAESAALVLDGTHTRQAIKKITKILNNNSLSHAVRKKTVGFKSIVYLKDGEVGDRIKPMTDTVKLASGTKIEVDVSGTVDTNVTNESIPISGKVSLEDGTSVDARVTNEPLNVLQTSWSSFNAQLRPIKIDSATPVAVTVQSMPTISGSVNVTNNPLPVSVQGTTHVQVDGKVSSEIVGTTVALGPCLRDNGADVVLVRPGEDLSNKPGNFYGSAMLVGVDKQYLSPKWDSIRAVATQENSGVAKLFTAS